MKPVARLTGRAYALLASGSTRRSDASALSRARDRAAAFRPGALMYGSSASSVSSRSFGADATATDARRSTALVTGAKLAVSAVAISACTTTRLAAARPRTILCACDGMHAVAAATLQHPVVAPRRPTADANWAVALSAVPKVLPSASRPIPGSSSPVVSEEHGDLVSVAVEGRACRCRIPSFAGVPRACCVRTGDYHATPLVVAQRL